jgi:hypothetical protein
MTGKPRAIHTWASNTNVRFIAVGTHSKLYAALPNDTAMVDITPAGFTTAGKADAARTQGYGSGAYGKLAYGTPRPDSSGTYQDASVWVLDNFGQYLVGVMSTDGKIYRWLLDIDTPLPATQLSGAPTADAIVVTPEGSLMALGAAGNPRSIKWSDQYDEVDWTPTASNFAGDTILQTSGRLMQGKRTRDQTIVLTDVDAFVAEYIGLPYVYRFKRIGDSCGAASRNCMAVAPNGAAYWMGEENFFVFDGVATSVLPCDIEEAVFGSFNRVQKSKVSCYANGQNQEIWWSYPSSASTENDRVAVYNYLERTWTMHQGLSRLAAVDKGIISNPLMTTSDGHVYNHELDGYTWGGSTPYIESGPYTIGVGERIARVLRIIFDEGTDGDCSVNVKTQNWPGDTERTNGPYASSNPTPVRFSGRHIRLRVEFANANAVWGVPRFEILPGSKR